MGRRGPVKIPTKILSMRGSPLAKRRMEEPEGEPGRPTCPAWLSKEAKRAWRELLPMIDGMGILSRTDRNALARYCQTWAKWRLAEEWMMKHGDHIAVQDSTGKVVEIKEPPQVVRAIRLADQLLRLEQQFGLTPSARAGLAKEKRDPYENRGRKRAEDRERFFGRA